MPNLSELCEERACYRQQSSKCTCKTQLRLGLDVCLYLVPIQCSPSFCTGLCWSQPLQLASLTVSPDELELMSLLPLVRDGSCQPSTPSPTATSTSGFERWQSTAQEPALQYMIYNSLFSRTHERPRSVYTFRWNCNPFLPLSTTQCLSGLTDHFLFKTLIEICTINNLPNWF